MAPDDRPRADETDPPAFLPGHVPHWAARGLAWLLLGLAAAAAVAAVAIRVPEAVDSRFVLVPVEGVDQVRVPRDGSVSEVRTAEARAVAAGDPLVVIRSAAVGDRAAELRGLQIQVEGAAARLANESQRHESQRRADSEEERRLRDRLALLGQRLDEQQAVRATRQARYRAALAIYENDVEIARREIEFKQQQHGLAKELADRSERLHREGIISWVEYNNRQLEVAKLSAELAQLDRTVDSGRLKVGQLRSEEEQAEIEWRLASGELVTERKGVRAAIDKLGHETAGRATTFRELERSLREDTDRGRVRVAALGADLAQSRGNEQAVPAPCGGTVVRLWTQRPGTVVKEGEPLADLACAGGRLQAELRVPPAAIGRVKTGQRVKLFYDAFPYQRHGIRYGTIRWVSPAAAEGQFRAFADVEDDAVRVGGERRPLVSGMGGRADVLTGRRPLVAYLFEPLRQLRETLADAPPPAGADRGPRP
jgi:HlyD family secretion protein